MSLAPFYDPGGFAMLLHSYLNVLLRVTIFQ